MKKTVKRVIGQRWSRTEGATKCKTIAAQFATRTVRATTKISRMSAKSVRMST